MNKKLFFAGILLATLGMFASQAFPRDSIEHYTMWGLFIVGMGISINQGIRSEK